MFRRACVDRDAVDAPSPAAPGRRIRRCTGFSDGFSAHCCACSLPSRSMKIASPGATSRTKLEAQAFQRDRFAGDHVFGAVVGLADADAQRPDAERIAERQQAVAGDQRHHRIGAAHAPVHAAHRLEQRRRVERAGRASLAASSCASTLSSTSESESVLMWRRSMLEQLVLQLLRSWSGCRCARA